MSWELVDDRDQLDEFRRLIAEVDELISRGGEVGGDDGEQRRLVTALCRLTVASEVGDDGVAVRSDDPELQELRSSIRAAAIDVAARARQGAAPLAETVLATAHALGVPAAVCGYGAASTAPRRRRVRRSVIAGGAHARR
jgi:hypothetical protein